MCVEPTGLRLDGVVGVHEVISRLPGIDQVRRGSRALAMLDAVLCPEPEARCFSFDARWSETEETALMDNGSGDRYSIVFSPEGAFALGFDHESPVSPYNSDDQGTTWPGLFDGVPEAFAAAVDEPAFKDENGVAMATVCFWRLTADDKWQCGPVAGVEKDGADRLFSLLADGRPEAYLTFAEDYYEVALELDAVHHVYALMPLTEEIVTALNPEVLLKNLKDDIAEIGYPRP